MPEIDITVYILTAPDLVKFQISEVLDKFGLELEDGKVADGDVVVGGEYKLLNAENQAWTSIENALRLLPRYVEWYMYCSAEDGQAGDICSWVGSELFVGRTVDDRGEPLRSVTEIRDELKVLATNGTTDLDYWFKCLMSMYGLHHYELLEEKRIVRRALAA